MKRKGTLVAVAVLASSLLLGCGGDIGKMLTSSPDMQAKVMTAISGNGDLAGKMMDQFLGADSTRTMLIGKLMENSGAAQEIMTRMAQNQTAVDGIINMAVQDSTMREHVMTLFKGMQMAAKKK
jgi:hypothetical protein